MVGKSAPAGNWQERIRVGTSGWHYRSWVGDFYPAGTRMEDLLGLYLRSFRTVEVDNSFYRLPSESTLAAWRDAVPRDFRFALKASRFITHMKKLKDSGDSFRLFFDRVRILGPKLGPILFQLPPLWKYNGDRLEGFLASLPRGPRYVFEFRHESWFTEGCYALLRKYAAGNCIYHWNDFQSPLEVTSKLVYVRFHGTRGKYGGDYSRPSLQRWAERMETWAREGREVWAFFNNDAEGFAPWNALTLMAWTGGPPHPPGPRNRKAR